MKVFSELEGNVITLTEVVASILQDDGFEGEYEKAKHIAEVLEDLFTSGRYLIDLGDGGNAYYYRVNNM